MYKEYKEKEVMTRVGGKRHEEDIRCDSKKKEDSDTRFVR